MRIRKLRVDGLFNLFDHEVILNLDEHITIMYGANGLGKTALLKLIHAFFNSQITILNQIPFDRFIIELDDDSRVFVLKELSKRQQKRQPRQLNPDKGIVFARVDKEGKREEYRLGELTGKENDSRLKNLEYALDHLLPVSVERLGVGLFRIGQDIVGISEVLSRYGDFLPFSQREQLQREMAPEWFRKIVQSLDVYFIQAQRLVAVPERRATHATAPRDTGLMSSVQLYSEEISKALKDTLTQYAELAQSLDRTFPARLVQQDRAANFSSDELNERLAALEKKRMALQSTGLLEDEQDVGFVMPEQFDPTTQNVLSVYVEDVEEKLQVFDTLADKVFLLKKIVDDRFLYKTLTISKDKGFLFANNGPTTLSPTQLSSGEQNVLVLLYELLFKVKTGSLILIDEPEISLHVAWQLEFLRDLQQVIKLSEFDVLIATHSPQIINDRWDLTVPLLGPGDQPKVSNEPLPAPTEVVT